MKSDVKAVRVTGTGSVFAGRTRLRGIILSNPTAGAGAITLQDGNSVTQFVGDCPAGDVFAFNIPEDGILFEGGMTVSALTTSMVATILLDK
jgi:hypothetical protein